MNVLGLLLITSPILLVLWYYLTAVWACLELNFSSRYNSDLRVRKSAELGEYSDEQIERYRTPFKWIKDDWYNGRSLIEIIIDLFLFYIPNFLYWMFMIIKKDYKDVDKTRKQREERVAKRCGGNPYNYHANEYLGFFKEENK